ncbi:MAG: hypothetical protein QNK22_05275, partial [Xanthomonadales bacterium]|nr:hypothetical protein [Xanthomonadales bacterium]
RIRRVDANTGVITTVAGTGTNGFSGDGGLATAADLDSPQGLAIDAFGNFFIADTYSNRIRRVDANTGVITTVAGTGTNGFSGDGGLATAVDLDYPQGLTLDSSGALFVADNSNHRVLQVSFLSTSDQFPYNPAASVDSDGDGFPDFFNSNATPQQIAASGLILDAFPDDPTAAVDMNHDGISDYYILGGELSSFLPLPNREPLIFSNSFE